TDGQILVMHDAFGITGGHIPRFAKNFTAKTGDLRPAVRPYQDKVKTCVTAWIHERFPDVILVYSPAPIHVH
ncbi:3-methyl-2-oxobutanoate hydroxymethyltransferase, partial [Escherichia coli]|uniref:3-methyl-2-oxobutanoate hydroxymethyltransferase n=1 Tax=Escherichia coli TaxID=562 RepID=UPI0014859437